LKGYEIQLVSEPTKCTFGVAPGKLIECVAPSKIKVITSMPPLTNEKEIRGEWGILDPCQ